jgi:hypothetical protein
MVAVPVDFDRLCPDMAAVSREPIARVPGTRLGRDHRFVVADALDLGYHWWGGQEVIKPQHIAEAVSSLSMDRFAPPGNVPVWPPVKPAVEYMRQRATDPIPAPIASPSGRRPASGRLTSPGSSVRERSEAWD